MSLGFITLERVPDSLADLGVRLTPEGGVLRLWSASATGMELCLFDDKDASWVSETLPLTKGDGDVWSVTTEHLAPGRRYSVRAGERTYGTRSCL